MPSGCITVECIVSDEEDYMSLKYITQLQKVSDFPANTNLGCPKNNIKGEYSTQIRTAQGRLKIDPNST